jgi:hypothetical protein
MKTGTKIAIAVAVCVLLVIMNRMRVKSEGYIGDKYGRVPIGVGGTTPPGAVHKDPINGDPGAALWHEVQAALKRLIPANKMGITTNPPFEITYTMGYVDHYYKYPSVERASWDIEKFLLSFPKSPPRTLEGNIGHEPATTAIFEFYAACRYLQEVNALSPELEKMWLRSVTLLKKQGYQWTFKIGNHTRPPRVPVYPRGGS